MTDLDFRATVPSHGVDAPPGPNRPEDDPQAGPILLGLARSAIVARGAVAAPDDAPDWLGEPGATFVTLTRQGRLRGCIGSVQARRRLSDDVVHNACAAAFHDPRFPPVAAAEVPGVRIEVSLLSDSEPLPSRTREELLYAVRPHVDGVILGWRGHRGTFLPQVWEQLPEPEDFIEHLLHKAGLPVSFWAPDLTARRFGVTAWTESEHRELVRP
jgi:AmmeMemoRadiSam system protein A